MALFTSVLFAFGMMLAVVTILSTLMPAWDRIAQLLLHGPHSSFDPLPPVRLTSQRGVIRQRAMAPVPVRLRAAA